MTICALLFRNSFPIAITDNLISNRQGVEDLVTPLTEKENREGLEGYKPAGVANKIWKVSVDNTIERTYYMMYSGIVEDAKKLSNYLFHKLCYQTVDEINVLDIESYIQKDSLKLSVILLYMDSNGYFSHYYINADRIYFYNQDEVLAIGSGAKDLSVQIQYLYSKHRTLIDNLKLLDIHEKIGVALLLTSQLTSDYLYLEDFSSFAKKSCGALYNIYTFPQLYYNSNNEIPNFIKNGTCQVFLDFCFVQNKFLIKRIVHTKQCYDESEDVISTTINLNADIPEKDYIKIPSELINAKVHVIRPLKDCSYIDNVNAIYLSSNQLIIYASIGNENIKSIHFLPNDKYDVINIKDNNYELEIKLNYMEEYNFFIRICNRILNYKFN